MNTKQMTHFLKMPTAWIILVLFIQTIQAQVKTPLEPTDVFDLEYISEPRISPDGSKIIYVRNFMDIKTDQYLSNLWMINADGTGNRPLTTGMQRDFQPRWSHDGSMITFKSNMQDNKVKLFLMWMDTRQYTALTHTDPSPGEVSWSYDNTKLAFTKFVPKNKKNLLDLPTPPASANWSAPPVYIDELIYRSDGRGYLPQGERQVFVMGIDGGSPVQITHSGSDQIPNRLNIRGKPEWSPDGRLLYFSANLKEDHADHPVETEIYQFDLQNNTITQLTHRKGPDQNPNISPNGERIAYTGFDDQLKGHHISNLYVMNMDGSNKKNITADFDRDVTRISWGPDSKYIYFMFHDQGITKTARIDMKGNRDILAEGLGGLSNSRPYSSGDYTLANNGSLAYTLGGTDHPADLAIFENGKTRRLTRLNDDLFSYRKISNVEEIWWESSFDKQKIHGWIVKPPDFDPSRKYPLILEIHGGPYLSYAPVFASEMQMFAAAGYVVLYANPRGSTSYGEQFSDFIHHNYPGNDYDDLMSGVDAVMDKGYIDQENLFVTGGSGGGLLSAWITTKTDRFKAAVVAKPVINWYSMVLYADMPVFFYQYWFPAKPWEDPMHYLDRSPISFVDKVVTPTMVITGENDFRTPMPESEQYYTALQIEGVPSALVRIPDSSHSMTNKPSMLIYKISSIISWFDHYKNQ